MLKVSDLLVDGKEYLVQGREDSYYILRNVWSFRNYIELHGDVKIVLEDERERRYMVPEFQEVRKRYSEWKQKDCEKYGCE